MPKCWARVLGDCDDTQTGEHLLTAALFKGKPITVSGLPWCADAPRTIGINSLTANILCTRHNSMLSPADEEATDLFDAIGLATMERYDRSRPYWRRVFDSRRLERWFTKTLINVVVSQNIRETWATDGSTALEAPALLVRAAFGVEDLRPGLGFYITAKLGQEADSREGVTVETIRHDPDGLSGAFFTFRGATFLMWIHGSAPAEYVTKSHVAELRDVMLFHRKANLLVKGAVKGASDHVIAFEWRQRTVEEAVAPAKTPGTA